MPCADITETASDFLFGVIARHALRDELVDPFLEVETKFLLQFGVDPASRAGKPQRSPPSARIAAHRAGAPRAAITIATASV